MKVCPGADEYGIDTEYKSCSKRECSGKMRRDSLIYLIFCFLFLDKLSFGSCVLFWP